MYSRTLTASLEGLSCESTWAEVDTENGMPRFLIVGLPNQSVKEAGERIHAAVLNCGFSFPARRVAVNLTPANKKKDGSHYDLAIAVSLLISTRQVESADENLETAYFGELSLDGKICPVEGILPMVSGLQKEGVKSVVIPMENLHEASLVKGMTLYPAANLSEVAAHVAGEKKLAGVKARGFAKNGPKRNIPDFSDIKGQLSAKRAAEIAAAGMHGLLIIGPPGTGKSMLCKRIPGILPPMDYSEQLEVTQIYSVAGKLGPKSPMIFERPFRAPHHTMSAASLIGGGASPRPGEVSLAHRGVLFLDELPEFASHSLETLRQPMEDGFVTITRVSGCCVFPSKFMLVAAMNPCRCGYYGDPTRPCTCTEADRRRYVSKISGPLLDRMDINISMQRPLYEELTNSAADTGPSSAELAKKVTEAFLLQKERYKGLGIEHNSELTPKLIEKFCVPDAQSKRLLDKAFKKWALSARAYHKVLKVARTIADTEGEEKIREPHILEALSYRMPLKYFK